MKFSALTEKKKKKRLFQKKNIFQLGNVTSTSLGNICHSLKDSRKVMWSCDHTQNRIRKMCNKLLELSRAQM